MPAERLHGEEWILSKRKREFDIATASLLLPFAIPVASIGATAFFAETRINPFFYQERLGRGNQLFKILKLRTMPFSHDLCDTSNGHADERASRVGRILRKTTIDELPQVFHILSGHMSFIGPRPLIRPDIEKTMDLLTSAEQADWTKARTVAKPGLLSVGGNLSREMEPQSTEYLRARVEVDCRYLMDASYDTDMGIIKEAFSIATDMVKR